MSAVEKVVPGGRGVTWWRVAVVLKTEMLAKRVAGAKGSVQEAIMEIEMVVVNCEMFVVIRNRE